MFDLDTIPRIVEQIRSIAHSDMGMLDAVVSDVEPLRATARAIKPRDSRYMSIVASDGGHNRLEFNPFQLQLIRVVDSYGKELFFDVVSNGTDLAQLAELHLGAGGSPTPLGRLMQDLGVHDLTALSPMLSPSPDSTSWFMVYREICEWATLYDLIRHREHATSTLFIHDGLLRSKVFSGDLFVRMYGLIKTHIEAVKRDSKRDLYLVGLAKRTQVQQQYELAMSLARVFSTGSPMFAPVPMDMQVRAYRWEEYVRSPEVDQQGESPKFNMGSMHFVRFGGSSGDPIWTVDLLESQKERAQEVFGCLLGDALNGFPIPFYPKSLQQADEHAQVAGFGFEILQDALIDAVAAAVEEDRRPIVDAQRLTSDILARRYSD